LQSELSNTEDRLQTARRFYNSNVRDYNRRVQSFPSNLVASSFGFKEEQFFEVDEALRGEGGVPHVDFVGETPGVTFGGQTGQAGPAPGTAPAQAEPGEAPPPPPAPSS
jgi:LemA protein